MKRRERRKIIGSIITAMLLIFASFIAYPQEAEAATYTTIPDSNTGFPSNILTMNTDNCSVVSLGSGVMTGKNTIGATEYRVKVKDTTAAWTASGLGQLKFTNAGKINGKTVDVLVTFNSLAVSAPYKKNTGLNDDGYMTFAYTADGSFWAGGKVENGHGYRAEMVVDMTLAVVYSGTNTAASLPFFMAATDLDAGSSDTYLESWEAVSGFTGEYCTYAGSRLSISGSRFISPGGGGQDGSGSWILGGVIAPTAGGTMRCRYTEGSSGTRIGIYSQYASLPAPALSVDSSKVYQAGDAATYSVTQKMGTFYADTMSAYSGLSITCPVPAGLSYSSVKVLDGAGADITGQGTATYNSAAKSVTFTFGTAWLADRANYNGQTVTMQATARTENPAQSKVAIPNTASTTITGIAQSTNTVSITAGKPVLSLAKSAGKEICQAGEQIGYEVSVSQTNSGVTGRNVAVTDSLPDGLALAGAPALSGADGTVEASGNTWTAKIPALAYGQTAKISFKASAGGSLAGTDVRNTAEASVDHGEGRSAEALVHIAKPAFSIEKTTAEEYCQADEPIEYRIKVSQTNEKTVGKNIVIRDSLPDGLALTEAPRVSGVQGASASVNGGSFEVRIPKLAYNSPATVTFTAEANGALCGSQVINTAALQADHAEPVQDEAAVFIPKPVIELDKEADEFHYQAGDIVKYRIVVNQKEVNAVGKNIVIKDSLPDSMTLRSAAFIKGSGVIDIDGNSFTAKVSELGYDNVVIEYEAELKADAESGQHFNRADATVSYGDNARDDAEIRVQRPVLSVEKTADQKICQIGDTVRYIVTVNQMNPDTDGRDIRVTDCIPAGLVLETEPVLTGAEGTVTAGENMWEAVIPSLAYGTTAEIAFEAKADSIGAGKEIINTAVATVKNGRAEKAESALYIAKPQLTAEKTTESTYVQPGDTVKYEVKITQTGEKAAAKGVDIRDTLPEGMVLQKEPDAVLVREDGTEEQLTAIAENHCWRAEAELMQEGDYVKASYEARILPNVEGELINTVTADFAYGDTAQAAAEVTAEKPALSIEKTTDKEVYQIGETVIYTVKIRQTNENITGRNVIVSGDVPEALSLTGEPALTGVKGNVAAGSSGWTAYIPELTAEETAVVTFAAEAGDVPRTSEIPNEAAADVENGSTVWDDAVITIAKPHLAITKEADTGQYAAGDVIHYTVKVFQTEENAVAKNVRVKDILPKELTLLGDIEVSGVKSRTEATDGGWTVTFDEFPKGTAEISFRAEARKDADGQLVNTAEAVADHAAPVKAMSTMEYIVETGDHMFLWMVCMCVSVLSLLCGLWKRKMNIL